MSKIVIDADITDALPCPSCGCTGAHHLCEAGRDGHIDVFTYICGSKRHVYLEINGTGYPTYQTTREWIKKWVKLCK